MLKGIDPRLNADVLYALRSMGHGDTVVLTDTNFPSEACVRETVLGELLRLENLTLAEASEAVLSVLPLDTFVDDFAMRMEIDDDPDKIAPVIAETQKAIDAAEGRSRPLISVERFAFYDLAREAFAIIQTGERRFYGNVIFRLGVIPPEE